MARDNQTTITISKEALKRISKLAGVRAKQMKVSKLSQFDYVDMLTAEEVERQAAK